MFDMRNGAGLRNALGKSPTSATPLEAITNQLLCH